MLGKGKDDGFDVKYSVKGTDPVQVPYGTFSPLTSSSCPAPGHSDKKPGSYCGAGETLGQEWPLSSVISPITDTPNAVDLNEPNWIPSWESRRISTNAKKKKKNQ